MMRKSISKINNMLFITQNQKTINMNNLKKITESDAIVKFYLKQKFGEDKPVNYVMNKAEQGNTSFKLKKHEEIEKYLRGKKKSKKDIIPQLSELYDENLCQTEVIILFSFLRIYILYKIIEIIFFKINLFNFSYFF